METNCRDLGIVCCMVDLMQPQAVLTADEIDLSAVDFWARPWEEREGAFQTLRRERPMPHYPEPEIPEALSAMIPQGDGYYALTRHADIIEASRHPEIYASGRGATSIIDLPEEMLDFFGSMINMDNPRHARLRRIVSAAFNPRMIKSIEDRIDLVANDIIDRVAASGACDFVTEVSSRLPLEIICDMMGIAPADYDTVFGASNVILSSGDTEYIPEGTDPMLALMTAAQQLNLLMLDLAQYRKENPTEDITSALVNTNIDGEALTDAEVASFFILLVVAGNETTRNAISHGLLAMTQYPDQRALWQADPEGIAATGVDEIVRWGSPVIWMRRTVAADTVLSGTELHAGDKVIMFYNSANRDEDVFEDPYTFDVRRTPNPHIGFGAAGPHFCLGAHLARQEIEVMFRRLFERLPDIRASSEPDRLLSPFINGIKHMDCTFTPVAAAR
jgi:methyl-branched lipid omega-hydroxylase